MNQSRKDTLRAAGHIWTRPEHLDAEWTVEFDRFICTTWQFGSIHQCKIWVKYEATQGGKPLSVGHSVLGSNYVAICRQGYKTRQLAMEKGVEWCEKYQKKGPDSVEKSFKTSMKHWGNLYPNRIAWIDHIFFVIGNGCDWLDGAIINTGPDGHIESRKSLRRMRKDMEKWNKEHAEIAEIVKKYQLETPKEITDSIDNVRLQMWNSDVYRFYPVSENYSAITQVPDDVRSDWLKLSYESALLLRDKSGVPDIKSKWASKSDNDEVSQKRNREIGAKVVADLESRFPQLIENDRTNRSRYVD